MNAKLTVVSAIEVTTEEEETPSPFIKGTYIQYAWDSTSLEWFKRCPRLYQYNQIEGWRPKDESVHLRFGIEYHKALHDYDVSRAADIKHNDAVFDVVRECLIRTADWQPDDKFKNRWTLIRTIVDYLDKFEVDPMETYIKEDGMPAVEASFRFELPFGVELSQVNPKTGEEDRVYQPYILCGHLDRIVRFNGDLYDMDRKTTKMTPGPYYFTQYEPHNQMTLYTLASKAILQAPVRGVVVDVASVKVTGSEFARGFTYRTQEQLDEWIKDLQFWLAKAEDYAAEEYWPMNDTACDKYGGCQYRKVCSKSPQTREEWLKNGFERGEKWNPLKSR